MRRPYHYTECGLDNVLIEGLEVVIDDASEEVYCIPNVNALHRVIAHGILIQEGAMSGKELRFLRTELGLTQAELGEIIKVSRPTIQRWEQEKTEIDPTAEIVVRKLAAEELKLDLDLSIEELSERSKLSGDAKPIRIDGSNPNNYQMAA